MTRRVIAVLLIIPALMTWPALAQETAPMSATVSVGYVMVPFMATNKQGRPLEDLKKREVTLYVDGRPVLTDLFERIDSAPISYAILLDASGSMGLSGKIAGARAAIEGIISRSRPGDEYSLHVFAEGVLSEIVPFTKTGSEILQAIDKVTPFGRTALFDALAMMPDKSLMGSNGSRAIILLTDGYDNASEMAVADLAANFEQVNLPVYPVALVEGSSADPEGQDESGVNLEVLEEVARLTGGRVSYLTEPEDLVRALLSIQKELRSQYLVGFSETGKGVSRFRSISLKLPRRARSVHVRAGYRGTEPPLKSVRGR